MLIMMMKMMTMAISYVLTGRNWNNNSNDDDAKDDDDIDHDDGNDENDNFT